MIHTTRLVTFLLPFKLPGSAAELPAGGYVVETDETLIPDQGVPATPAVSYFRLPQPRGPASRHHAVAVDPRDLDLALELDRQRYKARNLAAEAAQIEGISDANP